MTPEPESEPKKKPESFSSKNLEELAAVDERFEVAVVARVELPLTACCITSPKSVANPSIDATAVRLFNNASLA